jgi:hypothetical protein
MRDVQFSPNGAYLVVVTSIGNYAPGCDVAVRFPTAGGNGVTATWTSRLFDTPETVAVTDQAIYVGGHMRWLMAPGTEWEDWNNGNTNNQPDNTLARQQIGDLSISDGTALPWDPGATGQRGVLDLRVTDAGLLAGSDGEWFGGRQTYRHALFELPAGAPPVDNADPIATVGAPSAGATLNSPVAFSGTATDDAGVVDVLVSLRNMGTMQFLQLDGTFNDDGFQLHRTFVPGSGDTATPWQWTADLPDGNYRFTARAEDVAGKRGAVVTRNFSVGTVVDTQDPNGTITAPTGGQTLTSNTVNSTGTATDDVSVAAVSLIVRNRDTKEYLQGNGTFAAGWAKVPANLSAPGAPTTDWSWTGNLPDGRYKITLQVVDAAGKKDPTTAKRNFVVDA